MNSALGSLVASTAGQESHVPEGSKANKLQKNHTSSMVMSKFTYVYSTLLSSISMYRCMLLDWLYHSIIIDAYLFRR